MNYELGTEFVGGEASKVELRLTDDGSATLFVPDLDEHYHSRHGARQESRHVFIEAGLHPLLARAETSPQGGLTVLEVGLGTGLNALLTLEAVRPAGVLVRYDGYETYPLPPNILAALQAQWAAEPALLLAYKQLHTAPWNEATALDDRLWLTKIPAPVQDAVLPAAYYDLIYFDAFAPDKQPELWTEAVFARLHAAAAPGAVLVSYCAQGQFRRNLRAAGWLTEKLPGPPGKREMTRARKPL